MSRRTFAILVVLAAAPLPAAAQAGGAEARLREALRAANTRLELVETERAKLEASEAALQKENGQLKAQLAAAQGSSSKGKKANELARKLGEQEEIARRASADLAACESAAAEAKRAADEERGRLGTEATALKERVGRCELANAKMYGTGKEILDWLDELGFGAALAAREPFLGLRRVELENAAQEYRDKLMQGQVNP